MYLKFLKANSREDSGAEMFSADFPKAFVSSLPEIWVKMADARAHWVVNGGEIV